MSQKEHKDIPGMYDGPIVPITLRIGFPILIANVLHFLYAVVDTYFVSRIDPGSTALLSGTGLMFPVFFLFMALGSSIGMGLSTMVGRALGEKNREILSHVMPSGFLIVVCIAVPMMVGGFGFGNQIVRGLSGGSLSAEALYYAETYFRYLLPGLTLMLMGQVLMGVLQGEGLTGAIARATIVSTVLNMILDPLFIFGLKMGVAGAGLATSLAILVSSAYVAITFLRGRTTTPVSFNLFVAQGRVIREIIHIAFPHFLSMASLSISFMFLNKLVSSIDEGVMNSWTLAGRLDQLVLMPAFAIGAATVTMISQNYGRGNLDRVRGIYYRNISIGVGLVGFLALVFFFIAPVFFRYFSSVPEVVAGAVRQVRFLNFTYMGIAVAVISTSTFQATGRPIPALVLTIIRMGGIVLPAAFILTLMFELGIIGVYSGFMAGNLIIIPMSLVVVARHLNRLKFHTVAK